MILIHDIVTNMKALLKTKLPKLKEPKWRGELKGKKLNSQEVQSSNKTDGIIQAFALQAIES